jgi:hypothetical protein
MSTMTPLPSSERENSADLPKHLRDRLVSYAAAAGAALSVAAPAAHAKVVYVATNVDVTAGYGIDVGGTRVVTFRTWDSGDNDEVFYASVRRGVIASGTQAAKLSSGAQVGPQGPFLAGKVRMDQGFRTQSGRPFSSGPWQANAGPATGYLGFQFVVDGKRHFGWARLTFTRSFDPAPLSVTLTGYAYETIEDRPIVAGDESGRTVAEIAPEPSLGQLAFGSRAVAFWRKQ